MNAILFAGEGATLTGEELKFFNKAKKIIKQNDPNRHNKSTILTIVLVVLLISIVVFCTIFALLNINNNKILKNISVIGIDISELTREEAINKLNENFNNRLSTEIIFKHGEQTYTLLPSTIEFNYNVEKVVDEAYGIGRNGNIVVNNFNILYQIFNKRDLTPEITYNDKLISTVIPQMNEDFQDGVKQPKYEIEDDILTIYNGKNGYIVKVNEFKNLLISKLLLTDYNTDTIEIPVEMSECKDINVDEIHNEVYQPAQDASFKKDPYEIKPARKGLDFDISIEEAKAIVTGDQETYKIPLKTLYPSVYNDDLGIEAFPDLLAEYSTDFSSSNYNRATNVQLATRKMNGTVIMPGEIFSFNDVVGERTSAAGYKEGIAYSGGQVVTEIGGGICQVASTLYNTALRANMEIVYRTNHMYESDYVPIGLDATVSWGGPDLQFKNNRNYPIKIVSTPDDRTCYIAIHGLKQEDDCEVELISYRTGSVPYRTIYSTDYSLRSGQSKTIQSGYSGSTAVSYRVLKRNGEEISRELLARDTYDAHNEIIAVGP